MYYTWNCTKHGNYQFQEKYRPNCKQCFLALKEELEKEKKLCNEINSKLINAEYSLEKAKKVLGMNFADYILKEKVDK